MKAQSSFWSTCEAPSDVFGITKPHSKAQDSLGGVFGSLERRTSDMVAGSAFRASHKRARTTLRSFSAFDFVKVDAFFDICVCSLRGVSGNSDQIDGVAAHNNKVSKSLSDCSTLTSVVNFLCGTISFMRLGRRRRRLALR